MTEMGASQDLTVLGIDLLHGILRGKTSRVSLKESVSNYSNTHVHRVATSLTGAALELALCYCQRLGGFFSNTSEVVLW